MTSSPCDRPVPADYLDLGYAQLAVFRPTTGTWHIRAGDGSTLTVPWGFHDALPLPAPFLPRFGLP